MHYFVFQHPKHLRNRYYSGRIKMNSYRGNFDLERIRIALKMNYEIKGYGDHEIFKLLEKVDRAAILKGHILEVKDAKDAMWIKLNYDMIGKQGTKLIGTYRNFNVDLIRETVQSINAIRAEISSYTSTTTQYGFLTRSVNDFKNRVRPEYAFELDEILGRIEALKMSLEDDTARVNFHNKKRQERVTELFKILDDHLAECQLGSLVGT